QTGLPLLTGTNRHEYLLMRWEPATTAHQRARARRLAAAIDGSVSTDLFDRFYARGRTRRRCAMFMSDAIFTAPTRRLASVQPDGAAWMYRLDLEPPDPPGTPRPPPREPGAWHVTDRYPVCPGTHRSLS
ncbi:hypothetical protein MTQ16_10490, partial [Corynebacterium bovis]